MRTGTIPQGKWRVIGNPECAGDTRHEDGYIIVHDWHRYLNTWKHGRPATFDDVKQFLPKPNHNASATYSANTKLANAIVHEIESRQSQVKRSAAYLHDVYCPNPAHNDLNPGAAISLQSGVLICSNCNNAHPNQVADWLGINRALSTPAESPPPRDPVEYTGLEAYAADEGNNIPDHNDDSVLRQLLLVHGKIGFVIATAWHIAGYEPFTCKDVAPLIATACDRNVRKQLAESPYITKPHRYAYKFNQDWLVELEQAALEKLHAMIDKELDKRKKSEAEAEGYEGRELNEADWEAICDTLSPNCINTLFSTAGRTKFATIYSSTALVANFVRPEDWIRHCLDYEPTRTAYSGFYMRVLTGLSRHMIEAHMPEDIERLPLKYHMTGTDRRNVARAAKRLEGDMPFVIFSGLTSHDADASRNYKCTHASRYVRKVDGGEAQLLVDEEVEMFTDAQLEEFLK